MHKAERLRHKRLVDRLFREGKSFYSYPLRVVYLLDSPEGMLSSFKSRGKSDDREPCDKLRQMRIDSLQMLVNVPKRKMRHAVDRVWLRRRIREAWRLSRCGLKSQLSQTGKVLSVAIVYVGTEKKPYSTIAQRMSHILSRLETSLAESEKGGDE